MKNTNNTLAAIQLNQVFVQLKQDGSILMQSYCDYSAENGYDSVYDNDEDSINMMFDNTHNALRAAFYGDYNPSHAYFTFNGYGNLQSFEYLDSDNSPIDISELAQWLISEDKLSDYDITVTTLDDMLASIEDNLTDDSNMLHSLKDYLNIGYDIEKVSLLGADYETSLIDETIDFISDYDYHQLNDIINYLGINYQ